MLDPDRFRDQPRPDPGHRQQVLRSPERAVLAAVTDDALRQHGADPRQFVQFRRAGPVEIHEPAPRGPVVPPRARAVHGGRRGAARGGDAIRRGRRHGWMDGAPEVAARPQQEQYEECGAPGTQARSSIEHEGRARLPDEEKADAVASEGVSDFLCLPVLKCAHSPASLGAQPRTRPGSLTSCRRL